MRRSRMDRVSLGSLLFNYRPPTAFKLLSGFLSI